MAKNYIDIDHLREKIAREVEQWKEKTANHYTIEAEARWSEANHILGILDSLRQEQQDEQPEYGYLSTEYVHGKKSRWNVGDVLAYYISTSNEEGEYLLGKIVNVEFDEEEGWVYTFEDEGASDEQSLVEEGAYQKN